MSANRIVFTIRPAVVGRAGISRSTLYQRQAAGLFPPPVRVGARRVAFIESEVDAVLAAQARGASDAELRELVSELVAMRGARELQPAQAAPMSDDRRFGERGGGHA